MIPSTLRKLCLFVLLVLASAVSAQPDTLPPRVSVYKILCTTFGIPPCRNCCDSLEIREDRPNDVGIREIKVLSAVNMTITRTDVTVGARLFRTKVCAIDLLKDAECTLHIIDTVGNILPHTFCFDANEAAVYPMSSINACALVYDPYPVLQVTMTEPETIDISVVNVLGMTMASESLMTTQGRNVVPIDTKDLEAGIYFVSVRSRGDVHSFKLTVP